jgi:hypothetical protein
MYVSLISLSNRQCAWYRAYLHLYFANCNCRCSSSVHADFQFPVSFSFKNNAPSPPFSVLLAIGGWKWKSEKKMLVMARLC